MPVETQSLERPHWRLKGDAMEAQFKALSEQWKRDTRSQSSTAAITMHPAYLEIIGLGPAAIPLILNDLEHENNHWFIALRAIAGGSPVRGEDAGNLRKMREAWLTWGRENGLIR